MGQAGQAYARHNRENVPQMLSRRTEANYCKYSADCGPVQIAAHRQYKERGKDPVDSHIQYSSGSTLVRQIIRTGYTGGF